MGTLQDYTPTHIKVEGAYENDRNAEHADTFKAIIREVYGVTDVICGHHLVYEVRDKREDGFVYTFPQEIPSADALIFDHAVAQKLWPHTWHEKLPMLALAPVEGGIRDALLASYLKDRGEPSMQPACEQVIQDEVHVHNFQTAQRA